MGEAPYFAQGGRFRQAIAPRFGGRLTPERLKLVEADGSRGVGMAKHGDGTSNFGALTQEEKIALMAGASLWRTPALDSKGFRALKMSDGPHGVRGDGGVGGTQFPCGAVLGASWDPGLLRRLGVALGQEARKKAVSILLGPTINLQRTLLGGRNFEAYSEDPELTASLGEAFVAGVQSQGVAACPKHFVTNDCETERHSVSVTVDEQTLAEAYLYPFERAVRVGGAWAIMSAYHRLHGTYCAAHRGLLTDLLRDHWGFDGVVVSDWGGTYETEGPMHAGLDIEMPGPPRFRGAKLAEALAAGRVSEAQLDERLVRLQRLAARTADSLDAEAPEAPGGTPEHEALALEAAVTGMVLLKNAGACLPLEGNRRPRRIALLGPNGATPQYQGGGSSALKSQHAVSPEAGLREAFPHAEVVVEPGLRATRYAPLVSPESLAGEGARPWTVEFSASPDGPALKARHQRRSELPLFGADPALPETSWLTMRSRFQPTLSGPHEFSLISAGPATLEIDGVRVVDNETAWRPGDAFFGHGSEEALGTLELSAGATVEITVRYRWDSRIPFAGVRIGLRPPEPRDLWADALAAAEAADLAVVLVGLDAEWESEGADRRSFALPGEQARFIQAVAARNPQTVVAVNAGSPIDLDGWEADVAAILWLGYPGQAFGAALGAVLAGAAEPGGRLPFSFPRRAEDHPTYASSTPVNGELAYVEGRAFGHRALERPAFPFGHGLGYTRFSLGSLTFALAAEPGHPGAAVAVVVTLKNEGERAGSTVVQCYGSAQGMRPWGPRRLLGFQRVALAPRQTLTLTLSLPLARFAAFNAGAARWDLLEGDYELAVGFSVADLPLSGRLSLPGYAGLPREGQA